MGTFTLDNLSSGNWRLLIFYTSIPGVLSWILGMFLLDESALYCYNAKEYSKG